MQEYSNIARDAKIHKQTKLLQIVTSIYLHTRNIRTSFRSKVISLVFRENLTRKQTQKLKNQKKNKTFYLLPYNIKFIVSPHYVDSWNWKNCVRTNSHQQDCSTKANSRKWKPCQQNKFKWGTSGCILYLPINHFRGLIFRTCLGGISEAKILGEQETCAN